MGFIPVKTPLLIKRLFPSYVWNISSSSKIIYLTFDDGPTPEITNWTLNILEQYNAKATFFCIGSNIQKYPDIFSAILNKGHAIGNHTQNHIKGWKTKRESYLRNIKYANKVIEAQILKNKTTISSEDSLNYKTNNQQSQVLKMFRPPYGQITYKQGKCIMRLDYKIIMWDVLSFDWDNSITKEACLKNVLSKTVKGSIVVFHDSVKASRNMQYTLPKVLEYFSDKGYVFKTLECAF